MFCLKFHSRRVLSAGVSIAAFAALTGCGSEKKSETANQAPTAEAGSNLTISSTSTITLDGSSSYDPDGDPLTYHWAFDSLPTASALDGSDAPFLVNDTSDAQTSFVADTEGTYIISLIVTDALGDASTPDRVTVTISSAELPSADAGEDVTKSVGDTVTLDGSGSSDFTGRDLTYAWTFAQAPSHSALTELSSADTSMPTFTPDASGLYLIALVVNNGLMDSEADTVVVRVSATASDIPVAVAGDDSEAEDCTHVTLDGSDSYDPNEQPLTYFWDLESRPATSSVNVHTFADREAATTTFYPDVAGEYTVSLAVHDGSGWSVPDEMTITASERSYNTPPAVNPGLDKTHEGGLAICEESAYSYICGYCEALTVTIGDDAVISDPDNDTLSYSWSAESDGIAIHNPESLETSIVLSGSQPSEPDLCESNEYTLRLTATDCTGSSTSQTVTHTVTCCGYVASDAVDTATP